MSDYEGHCIQNDAELFAAQDDLADFAIEHAAELAARDREASLPPLALSSVQCTPSVSHRTQGA